MWVMWPVLKVHFVAKETGQYSGKMMKKRKAQVFLCRNSTQTIYDFACGIIAVIMQCYCVDVFVWLCFAQQFDLCL